MEPDDQRVADAKRGCSQITGWAEQHGQQCLRIGLVLLQVQRDDLRAFRGHDAIDLFDQVQRVSGWHFFLARVDLFDGLDTGAAQELLGFNAARSARAVIAPVDLRHDFFSRNGFKTRLGRSRVRQNAGFHDIRPHSGESGYGFETVSIGCPARSFPIPDSKPSRTASSECGPTSTLGVRPDTPTSSRKPCAVRRSLRRCQC